MFNHIPQAMQNRMMDLKRKDTLDCEDGIPRLQRLRQIPPVTGQFVAMLAATSSEGRIVEIGTSAGYPSMWILQVCEMLDRTLTTFEVFPEKNRHVQPFRLAASYSG